MTYVRNAWYVAGWSRDLSVTAPTAFELLGTPLVLWRRSDGSPVAFEDRCVHRLAPLSLSRCEGDRLRCMYHGDAAKRDMMMAMAGKAFAEDKTMIEAQHRHIESFPDPRIMPTAHDRGVTLYNRLVERLAATEIRSMETAA